MRSSDRLAARSPALAPAVRRALLIGSAAAVTALVAPAPAHAYCRTSVCPGRGTASVCSPAQAGDCGIPLFWPSPCISYSIQKDASTEVSLTDTETIFATAFDTWTHAACGKGGTPRVRLDYTGPIECKVHEYNQENGNANVIVYRDDDWPYTGGSNTLALTTVTYNLDTGEIYDADMELNSFQEDFSLGDDAVTFDLLSIATHETGHFLGLSHSADVGATMYTDYKPGSINLRDLSEDDRAAICAVYPPGDPIGTCDSTARHGFSDLCGADQPEDAAVAGCSCAVPGRRSSINVGGDAGDAGGAGGPMLAALTLLGAALRRARRSAAAPSAATTRAS